MHQSGCADVRVPDDETALDVHPRARCARLPSSGADFYRHGADAGRSALRRRASSPASFPPITARPTTPTRCSRASSISSLFWEVMPERRRRDDRAASAASAGSTPASSSTARACVDDPEHRGAQRAGGILYREGIAKITAFSRACNDDGIPLVWLQDISGFDIGVEAERQGLLGYGSSLIYTNSTNTRADVHRAAAQGVGRRLLRDGRPALRAGRAALDAARAPVGDGGPHARDRHLQHQARRRLPRSWRPIPAERAEIEAGMRETEARIEGDMDPYRRGAPDGHRRDRRARRAARLARALRRGELPVDRLPPHQEPAHLVAARPRTRSRSRAVERERSGSSCWSSARRPVAAAAVARGRATSPARGRGRPGGAGCCGRRAARARARPSSWWCPTASRVASRTRRRCATRQPVGWGDLLYEIEPVARTRRRRRPRRVRAAATGRRATRAGGAEAGLLVSARHRAGASISGRPRRGALRPGRRGGRSRPADRPDRGDEDLRARALRRRGTAGARPGHPGPGRRRRRGRRPATPCSRSSPPEIAKPTCAKMPILQRFPPVDHLMSGLYSLSYLTLPGLDAIKFSCSVAIPLVLTRIKTTRYHFDSMMTTGRM